MMMSLLLPLLAPSADAAAPSSRLLVTNGVPATVKLHVAHVEEDANGNETTYETTYTCTPSASLTTSASTGTLSCEGLGPIDAVVNVVGGQSVLRFDNDDVEAAVVGQLPGGATLTVQVGGMMLKECFPGTIQTREVTVAGYDKVTCDYLCVQYRWHGPLPLTCIDENGDLIDLDAALDSRIVVF